MEPTLSESFEQLRIAWEHLLHEMRLSLLVALEAIARFGAL